MASWVPSLYIIIIIIIIGENLSAMEQDEPNNDHLEEVEIGTYFLNRNPNVVLSYDSRSGGTSVSVVVLLC